MRARIQELVAVKFEVPIPPIQRPQPGFSSCNTGGRSGIASTPGRSPPATAARHSQIVTVAGRDVTFDPDLIADTVSALDWRNTSRYGRHRAREVRWQPCPPSMPTVIGGRLRYPVAQEPSTCSSRWRGLSQSSTRRGRSLSLSATLFRSSWVRVRRSAFLRRY